MKTMLGEYIEDRWIVKMIQSLCGERDIVFSSWSDDWLMELQKDDQIHRIIGYRFDLNDSVSTSISQDKVATHTVLARKGIPTVPHELVRTKVSHANKKAMKDWQQIVIKPLDGTSGHGVQMLESSDEAVRVIEASHIQAWAASPFIDIRREVRVVMLDGEPLLIYEKQPVTIDRLKMFNLGLGATPIDIDASDQLIDLARRAQSALGLRLSAVDVIEDRNGELQVLEINDAIMMEHYARYSETNKNRAKAVYGTILDVMFE